MTYTHRNCYFHLGCLFVLGSLLLSGCGKSAEDSSRNSEYTQATEVPSTEDAKMTENTETTENTIIPEYQKQMIPVAGTSNLWELHPEELNSMACADVQAYGDNLLLIQRFCEESASFDEEYEGESPVSYSFALYSPMENRILATIDPPQNVDVMYTVRGSSLTIQEMTTETINCYDENLQLTATYHTNELDECFNSYLYPTADSSSYLVNNFITNTIYSMTFSGDDSSLSQMEIPIYNPSLVGITKDGSSIVMTGIDPDSLCNGTFFVDAASMSPRFFIPHLNNASDQIAQQGLLVNTDYFYNIWGLYYKETQSGFFRLPENTSAYLLDDERFMVCSDTYDPDSEPALHEFHTQLYDANGKNLSSFSYSLTGQEQNDFASVVCYPVYIEKYGQAFQYIACDSGTSYLLVWDPSATVETSSPLAMFSSYDELLKQALYEENSDKSEFQQDLITMIPDTNSYDWGVLADENEKATELEKKYHVEIYIGEEIPPTIDGYSTEQCTDEQTIQNCLNKLDELFSTYPDNFFDQAAFGPIEGLRFYIMEGMYGDSANNQVAAAAGLVTETYNHLVMALAASDLPEWDYTIHHELSHIIDRRLTYRSQYVEDSLFSEETWASYNPSDCEYTYNYSDYWGNETYTKYPEYFVDDYSATYETEDRATLFGCLMVQTDSWMNRERIDTKEKKEKLIYYCQCIRDGFDTTGWPEQTAWEKSLTELTP